MTLEQHEQKTKCWSHKYEAEWNVKCKTIYIKKVKYTEKATLYIFQEYMQI